MSGFTGQNKPVLAKLVALAATVASVATGGTAELPSRRLGAGVTLAGGTPLRRATGGAWTRNQDFMIQFSYRVSGDEGKTEQDICDAVDLLTDAILTDPTLGGLVINTTVDNSLASSPDYSTWTLQERRIYPLMVTVTQTAQIPIP